MRAQPGPLVCVNAMFAATAYTLLAGTPPRPATLTGIAPPERTRPDLKHDGTLLALTGVKHPERCHGNEQPVRA